jgi:oxygen-independent coproporphyrinogen-3 oxidase
VLLYISVLLAGIYIHIPFCKKKCYYCDFFTSQNLSLTNNFLLALFFEINSRKDYLLADKIIETIYFGGGTPTTLKSSEIELILNHLKFNFNIPPNIELAIEANPDDLSEQYLEELIKLGFNRISIGIQSFNDEMLALMNRRHNSENAINSVENAQKAGFDNISVDLIYGLPKSNVDFVKK